MQRLFVFRFNERIAEHLLINEILGGGSSFSFRFSFADIGRIVLAPNLRIEMLQLMAMFHLYLRGPGATEFHQLLSEFGPLLTNAGNR